MASSSSSYAVRFLSLLAITYATPLHADSINTARGQSVQWGPCPTELSAISTAPIDCGSFIVPLDYTRPSNETVNLELVRIPALRKPSKGSIFFNFGGPGDDGKNGLAGFAKLLLGLTGGQHDLINIVPRGTGNTLPFSCYLTEAERLAAKLQFPIVSYNSSNVAPGRAWGAGKILSETCFAAQNKTGRFIGTAFVARDLMRVVDALGEDGMLRYWGISYGTVLGATVISMFPDRVDKVILDGVVNAHEYYHTFEPEQLSSNDDVLKGFCSGCIESPESCPLARNRTAAELEKTIYDTLETLKSNPIAIYSPGESYLLDYTIAQQTILDEFYTPQSWPKLSVVIDGLVNGNISQLVAGYIALSTSTTGAASTSISVSNSTTSQDAEAVFGIRCSDKFARRSSLSDMLPDIEERQSKSKIMGDSPVTGPVNCAQWKMDAEGRYSGDFKVKTRNPVLLIGNTFDPVTPLVSAHNMSSGFEGSVVLQHNSYGHCSYLTQASLCTAKAIKAYFTAGTLPKCGTVCDIDVPLFSGKEGWEELLGRLE